MEEMCFSRFLKMVRIQLLGLSYAGHQMGTVNVKVCGSYFVSLWDGTVMRRSLAERKLLEAYKSEVMNLGKGCRVRGASVGKH